MNEWLPGQYPLLICGQHRQGLVAPLQILLAVDIGEDLVDEERIAVASIISLQAAGIFRAKFDAPQANRLVTYDYAILRQETLDIAVIQAETVAVPGRITDDSGRKSTALVKVHPRIFPSGESSCQYHFTAAWSELLTRLQ